MTSLTSVDFQGWLRKLRRDDDNKEIEIYGHSKALFPTLWHFPRILKGKHCILQLLLLSLLGIFFGPSDMQGFGMPDHSVSAAICRGHFPGYKAVANMFDTFWCLKLGLLATSCHFSFGDEVNIDDPSR